MVSLHFGGYKENCFGVWGGFQNCTTCKLALGFLMCGMLAS